MIPINPILILIYVAYLVSCALVPMNSQEDAPALSSATSTNHVRKRSNHSFYRHILKIQMGTILRNHPKYQIMNQFNSVELSVRLSLNYMYYDVYKYHINLMLGLTFHFVGY